jgi:hypothetical protein
MTQCFIPEERNPETRRCENLDEPDPTYLRNCLYHRGDTILLIFRLGKRDVLTAKFPKHAQRIWKVVNSKKIGDSGLFKNTILNSTDEKTRKKK